MVKELTADNFKDEITNSKTPVIVDFWASWCMPCRMMAPVFEEVSKEFEGKMNFVKISTEDHPGIAEEYDISGIPCLVVFHAGTEVDRIVGFSPKEVLKGKVEEILSSIK